MTTSKSISLGILKAVAVLICAALMLYFLYLIQTVLIYLVIALILTLIGKPIVRFFTVKLKFPNTLATAVTLFIFVAFIGLFILMFVPLITAQGENLSVLNVAQVKDSLTTVINQVNTFLASYGIHKNFSPESLTSGINLDLIPNFLNSVLGTLSSIGVGLVSVLFITFFFIKDRRLFVHATKKLIPASHETQITNSIEKINDLLSRYFIGLVLQLTIIFILYLIVLLIFGIENAFIIAFICSILNIIPYIGPVIASVLVAVLTMISHIGDDFNSVTLPATIYVLIGFSVVQFIDNNFSQPIIFSKSTASHPLEIFLVILCAGFLSGILGMVIAVPLYTILKVIAKEFFPENALVRILTKNL